MHRIKGELQWRYHPELNELMDFDDELTAVEIANAVNAKKSKIESSVPDVEISTVKQSASVVNGRLIVVCY